MKTAFLILLPFCFVSCIPLPQTRITPEQDDFDCHVGSGRKLYVAWRSTHLDPAKQPNLDLSASWAISPTGARYSFTTVERTYHTGERSYWKDTSLVLMDSTNPNKPMKWHNGSWLIRLEFTKSNPRSRISAKIDITTLHYNPILHGPPN